MSKLQTRRLGYALGAEVTGIDFSRPISEETVAEIRQAWLEHVLLCFPGFNGQPGELAAFCQRFGDLDDNRANPTMRHPKTYDVLAIANKTATNGARLAYGSRADEWHSDRSYTDRPASATFLTARALPEVGGDTMFANMYLAFESLSSTLQSMIEPLDAVYDFTFSRQYRGQTPQERETWERTNPAIVHRIVRTHPETGRKALCLDTRMIRNFVGMTEEESKPILDYLAHNAVRYEFVYRHRWTVGDLLMWDNRCAMHYAVPDFNPAQLRRMERVSLWPPQSGSMFAGSSEKQR